MRACTRTYTHLQAVQPVPFVGGILDFQELQDSDKNVGVVIRQNTGQQAVDVVKVDVEAASKNKHVISTSSGFLL